METLPNFQTKVEAAIEKLIIENLDVVLIESASTYFVVREDSEQGQRQLEACEDRPSVYTRQTISGVTILICPTLVPKPGEAADSQQ